MSLYATPFYATSFYGSDEFGLAPGGPANLNAYQNNIDTVVLYWALEPCTPAIHDYVWTVDVDTEDTFASPEKITYVTSDQKVRLAGALVSGNTVSVTVDGFAVSVPFTTDSNTTLGLLSLGVAARPNVDFATVIDAGSGTDDDRDILIRSLDIENPVVLTLPIVTGGASQTVVAAEAGVDFIPGRLQKGVAVPIYARLQGAERPMYWRVHGTRGMADTTTVSSVFSIPRAIDEVSRDAMLNLMPDPIYKKSSDSNNYGIHWTYGHSLDDHFVGDVFANNDISLRDVRDVSIQSDFGDMVKIMRPQNMKAIDFREIMRQFFIEARESPNVRSVRNVVRSALCDDPLIVPIRDILEMYVDDSDPLSLVPPFYVDDDNFYQDLTFLGPLVAGNIYTIKVDGNPVVTPFNTDSNTTMADIAVNIALEAGVAAATVIPVAGPGNNRVIAITAAIPATPPVLTDSAVTGGASQTIATPDQTITFDGPLVTGNTYSIKVNGSLVSVPFLVNSDLTMGNIAMSIAAKPGVASATVVLVPAGANNDRVIIVSKTNILDPLFLTDSLVTGGLTQAIATASSNAGVLPAAVWNSVHLAGGIIVEVTNSLGAIVDKRLMQDILRKLILANFPLYVTGIA